MKILDSITVTTGGFMRAQDMTIRVHLSGPLRLRLALGLAVLRVGAWLIGAKADVRQAGHIETPDHMDGT